MKKIASMFAVALSCLAFSGFADEPNEASLNDKEVIAGDITAMDNADVQQVEEGGCGCGGKPKKD